jgi:hypothetical protein
VNFPVDADLCVFFYTVGKVLLTAMPRLRQLSLTKNIPVDYQVLEVKPSSLTTG